MSSDETISSYLRCLPLVADVWNCVDEQPDTIKELYWKNASLPWKIPEGRLSYFVRNLINVARSDRAVDLLSRCRKDIADNEVDLVFEALEALPLVERAPDEPHGDSLSYELQELFKVLYRIGMSQVERLVWLELLYHEIFEKSEGRQFQPKGLLAAIRDSPHLFVDLLRYLWKDDAGKSNTSDDDATQALANQIGRLLHHLAELPGQSELCPMSDKKIANWVAEVVQIAADCQCLSAVGLQLPDIIVSGAWRAFETWPTADMAEAINILADAIPETFPQQLSISLSNARGVYGVDPSGQSEKDLASKLRERADKLQPTCPAASRALRDVAQSLESQATQNVERAKWER